MAHHPVRASLFAAAAAGPDTAVETLPGRLAAAVATALGADGTSLGLLSFDLRVPLAASDAEAGRAEQLQFTVGEGPCLHVVREGRAVVSDLDDLRRNWPAFAERFTATTSYRSVLSVPLPFTARGDGGALDVYLHDPSGAGRVDLADAVLAAETVVDLLVAELPPAALAGTDDASQVPWLSTPGASRRMEVWVAMGILTARLQLDTDDALAWLRAQALADGSDVDTVAARVVAESQVTGPVSP